MPHIIIGLGEVLWDLLPDGKQLGGAPANFAYHARALDLDFVDSYLVSAIGDDSLGQELHSNLNSLHINTNYLHISHQYKTGTVSISLDKQGNPSYLIEENVAWDYIPVTFSSWPTKIDVICFGTLALRSATSKKNIIHLLENLADTTIKIFDINLRQSFFSLEIIDKLLKIATVLKINDDELKVLAKLMSITGTEKQLLEKLSQQYQLNLCILTRGASGSLLYANGQSSTHSGFKINVKDTIGAGDAFTAAIAIGLLKELNLGALNTYANQVAAYVCSHSGATPKISTEIMNLYKSDLFR